MGGGGVELDSFPESSRGNSKLAPAPTTDTVPITDRTAPRNALCFVVGLHDVSTLVFSPESRVVFAFHHGAFLQPYLAVAKGYLRIFSLYLPPKLYE